MCHLPGVGLVQCLLGNLWAEYSFPKSWTSPAWGLDIERRASSGLVPEPGQNRGPTHAHFGGQHYSLPLPWLSLRS